MPHIKSNVMLISTLDKISGRELALGNLNISSDVIIKIACLFHD